MNTKTKGAIFLDRDGTVIIEKDYLNRIEQVRLIPNAAKALRHLRKLNLPLILITNQSAIARGYCTEEYLKEIHNYLEQLLAEGNAYLDAIYYCPHHPDFTGVCDCRKPNIGMLKQAAKDFNIDLSKSILIGDNMSDIEAAHNATAKSILVLTGYGKKFIDKCNPDYIADDLLDAVEWLFKTNKF